MKSSTSRAYREKRGAGNAAWSWHRYDEADRDATRLRSSAMVARNRDDAFCIQYAIGCETPSRTIWDNNFGHNYVACRRRLKILTLNLHCSARSCPHNFHGFLCLPALRDLLRWHDLRRCLGEGLLTGEACGAGA